MPNEIIANRAPKKRLEYLDYCKVLAIFLVTVAHCAQQISGSKFPEMVFSKDSFISVNMAVFMIASGFVMNIDKMRNTSIKEFFLSKAIRLLFPMTAWYIVMCMVTSQRPRFTIYWSLYWYLGAMFVCLLTIKILADYISNTLLVCFLSIIVLSCIPMISFERSCYMIPFLWVGFFLRLYNKYVNKSFAFLLLFVFSILYYFWDIKYSIYMSPFHIWNVSYNSVFALIFRFLIGVVGGFLIISSSKILIELKRFDWMRKLAKLGPYTLGFYTMSFVLNAMIARVLWHFNYFITTPGLLDIVSIMVTIPMIYVMYRFQLFAKRSKWLSLFFLGERL